MRHTHLVAALFALLLAGAGLVGGLFYADALETQYVHAYASSALVHKRQGLALQRVAFRQTDLLPVYGSSELLIPDPFRADKIFRLYPTGFNVFFVGGNGIAPLLQAQTFAGLGDAVRGKRVVVSLSPQFFIESQVAANAYSGNFSRLHAYAFAQSNLPLELKQRIAKRMLEYPAVLESDPLLKSLLEGLATRTVWSPLHDAAVYPFAQLQLTTLQLQDRWATVELIQTHPEIQPDIVRRAQPLNWQMLQAHAAEYAAAQANNNSFAIDNTDWTENWADLIASQHADMPDPEFQHALDYSHSWADLELLLATLQANGATPLITSMPWHEPYWEYRGVSAAPRRAYYARLKKLAHKYAFPVVTFESFENQKYFLRDPGSHLAAVGWVEYSRALDSFFYDRTRVSAR